MAYRRYTKNNSTSKGIWAGVIAFVMLVLLAVSAISIANNIEDNKTQLEETEAETETDTTVETETEVEE